MVKALFITVLTISFLPGLSSFAATHGDAGTRDNLLPALSSEIIIGPLDYADEEHLETLLEYLNDPDPFVRVEAIQTLGEIKKERSLVSLFDCLNDENIYVRAYAAEALGKIGTIDVSLTLSKLVSALDDPSSYVRAMMAAALGELQDTRAIAPLKEMLQDKDETVKRMAVWALGYIEKSQ